MEMKRKIIAAGIAAAAVLAATVSGYRTTTLAAGPAGTESYTNTDGKEIQVSLDLQAFMESMEAEELKSSPAAEITAFATKVQNSVSEHDLAALADLCDFPIQITMEDGRSCTVPSREDFIALGRDSVFTRNLVHEIGIADPSEQQLYGNGIVMGNKNNVIINRMDGSLSVTGFNF
ncbi:hypothetical protein V3C10_00945 [[Clostridium] symbiosum]|uniref:hypothetical protein n=1 Tax=Clostridium symbiosum TaxID=1512 RepID=UPI001D061384|nr:hypothetical protein [[Clostridium] symbiosum]MCB6610318.1 hypothetical protein [[Clostridium] symbiosum]MCB6932389.1 hypothetical protein [[Clostridium] symbiosum]